MASPLPQSTLVDLLQNLLSRLLLSAGIDEHHPTLLRVRDHVYIRRATRGHLDKGQF